MLAEGRELPFHYGLAIEICHQEVESFNIFLGNDSLVTIIISGTLIPGEKCAMNSPKCFT